MRPFFVARTCGAIALSLVAILVQAADLTSNRSEIAVGGNVTVKLKSVPFLSDIDWAHSPGLTKLETERGKARFRGASPGLASVTVLIDGKPEGRIEIRVVDATGGVTANPPSPAPGVLPVEATPSAGGPPIQSGSKVNVAPIPGVGTVDQALAGGTPSPAITLGQAGMLSLLQTYHWNEGRGAVPGTLGLVDAQGRRYGPWPATGVPGPGGIANVYWSARPMIALPAGTYAVVDSDPASWTPNPQNGGRGYSHHEVETLPTTGGATSPTYPGYGSGTWVQPGQAGVALGSPVLVPGAPQGGMPVQGVSKPRTLLDINNNLPVEGRPKKGSKLDLDTPHVITLIRTYHWNDGLGAPAGSIGLSCRDGSNHGPWQAIGEASPNGVPNAYWTVRPNAQLPACICAVVVSDPQSWSHNDASRNRGFVLIEGYELNAAGGLATKSTADTTLEGLERASEAVRKMDETRKALESLKNIFK